MANHWQDKRVTILGLSKSGIAAARYLSSHGAECFLSETLPATPANKEQRMQLQMLGVEVETGGHTAKCFDHSDLVVVSPGIPPHAPLMKELGMSGKTIISEVELAYRETQTPWVAITGTNGKTTTTTLTSRILQAWGKHAPACGNIGTPVIELISGRNDYLVAELSSYQLQFSPTLRAKVAVLLNFTPDHLDWHGSVEAYKWAKFNLFIAPHTPEWAVLNASDPVCRELESRACTNILWFSRHEADLAGLENTIQVTASGDVVMRTHCQTPEVLFNVKSLKLVGGHNQDNAMAAAATCRLLGCPIEVIRDAVYAFEGVEHRLEPVATVDDVKFYNDSKATNPDATLSALAAFSPQKVVLIAGGRDKMGPLDEFVSKIKIHANHVVLIGEATRRFREALEAGGYLAISEADSLESAVLTAKKQASNTVPVLFSPACASFDMFKNFESRGEAFKAIVHALKSPVLP